MLSVAVFLRLVPRLAALSAVLTCLIAAPALAGPDDEQDPQSKFSQWLQRTKSRVQETADRLPPEWRKWIPKRQGDPQYRGDTPDARMPNRQADPEYRGDGPRNDGPRWPSLPDLGGRGGRISASQLDRVEIGYQAGVLKIATADGRVVYKRHKPGCELVAIDTVDYAPVDDENRREIFAALGIREGSLESSARSLVDDYGRLPHTKALAVLGVIASTPSGGLSEGAARQIRRFLAERLRAERDVKVHRMAVLSLAVASETDDASVSAVLDLMDHSHNAWETFTCQQFFRYHRDEIRSRPSAWNVRRRLACTGNPYGPSLAADF